MSLRLTLLFDEAERFASTNGTLSLFQSMQPALLGFAKLLGCTGFKGSGEHARGIEFLRGRHILFVFYVERLRANLPGVCALSIDTGKFAPHLGTALERLIASLETQMQITVPKDGTYRFPSIGFRTPEQGTHVFDELSRLMRFAIEKHGPDCFGPRATWVKGFDEFDAAAAERVDPAPNADQDQDAEAELRAVAEHIHDDGRSSGSDPESPPPDVDAVVWRQICERRGQQRFRRNLLAAYGGQCAITGCRVEAALEAAHLTPHSKETNYDVTNGIMLRADIHTLFDLHLISIDPSTMRVRLHPSLIDSYEVDGELVRLPTAAAQRPSEQCLREHFQEWLRLAQLGLAEGQERSPADVL